MFPKNTPIFASHHPSDADRVRPALGQIKAAGWSHIATAQKDADTSTISGQIQQSKLFVVFLGKAYAQDDRLMLEQFAYAAVILRTPFLPVWLDGLPDIQKSYETVLSGLEGKERENKQQLLSALEMLTAKHPGTTIAGLGKALENFTLDQPPYTPSTPQICEKPCEAYEGDAPYIFISYAHDDAPKVYPHVKALHEAGWDLWYDEGIKTTERYLPVIADHIRRSAAFVLMLTNRCLERPFVMNYELEYAKQLKIPIVPVLLEELSPPEHVKQTVEQLLKDAIQPDSLLKRIPSFNLANRGTRVAVPPAIRQNVVYDVVLPPEMPGFVLGAYDGGIAIVRYVGDATEVVIPSTVSTPDGEKFKITRIGDNSFEKCKSLTGIVIPKGVTRIGDRAFSECESLASITIPKGVTSIGDGAFGDCVSLLGITIPESVTRIGENAFQNCFKLNHISISDGVTNIADDTFHNCFNLINITIPKSVTDIGNCAFKDCYSLTRVIIPKSVTSIGLWAFAGCKKLRDIIIPKSVIYIHDKAFENCPARIPGRGTFANVKWHENQQSEYEQKKSSSLEIPDCKETPYALVCCEKKDLEAVRPMLIELYWEGFNIKYEENPSQQTVYNSKCILAFFTNQTTSDKPMMEMLNDVVKQDASNIIQVFLGDCIGLPEEIKHNLQARQAIIQSNRTELAFSGGIRDALRDRGCCLNHPRGFEVKNTGNAVEIVRFQPAGFSQVVIPKTFFNPPLPVTSIGKKAFKDSESLTSIIVPDGVINVDDEAFSDCISLTSITVPDSVINIGRKAFSDCVKLTDITIPKGVTSIGAQLFSNCGSLTRIAIPRGITSIGESAFEFCGSLLDVTIPESVTSIGSYVFRGCKSLTGITLPKGVGSIGGGAFLACASLRNITIPEGVTNIEGITFLGCESLDNISIPEGVISIGRRAFGDCDSLVNITIPESVTNIDKHAFSGCVSLASITIKGVVSIGDEAFKDCCSLTNITILKDVTSIGERVFSGCVSLTIYSPRDSEVWKYAENGIKHEALSKQKQKIGTAPSKNKEKSTTIEDDVNSLLELSGFLIEEHGEEITIKKYFGTASRVVIPSVVTTRNGRIFKVTRIGDRAFMDCKSLVTIEIPDSVTSIGGWAFSSCTSLLGIIIPKGVTSIEDGTFDWCKSLQYVCIPERVTSISKNAFDVEFFMRSNSIKSLVIQCFHGSKAMQYAKKHKLKYELLPESLRESIPTKFRWFDWLFKRRRRKEAT